MKLYAKWMAALIVMAGAVVGVASENVASASSSSQEQITMPAWQVGTYMDWMKTVYSRQSGESLVQEPLVVLNANGSISGAAAESWTVSKNKLTWTFHLRHLKWSNGTPLTASDYVFAFQHAATPSTGYDFGWFWGTVVGLKNWNSISAGHMSPTKLGVSAPNDYTLQVTTASPVPFLPNTMIYAFPEPPTMVKKYGDAWSTNPSTMLFSGPYKVQQWVQHQYITFVPNPSYHGVRHHNIPKVTFDLVPQTDYSGFQTNQVSWSLLDPGQLRAAEAGANPNANLVTMKDYWINMLGFNVKVKPLNNPDVRKAISLAIDKSILVNNVLHGLAAPDNSVVPSGFPGYDPSIKEPFNVKEAQQLLAKAGYAGGKNFPTLILELRNEPSTIVTTEPGAEYIQSELLSELGIHIQIKVLDMPTWTSDVSDGKAQLFIRPYNYDYMDPSDWYSLFLPGGVMTWNSPKYNQLVKAANSSFNATQRTNLYNQAAQVLNSDTGAVFLWSNVQGYLVNKDVGNFPTSPLISVDTNWVTNLTLK